LSRVEAFTRKKIQLATLPSEEDIHAKREASLTGKMVIWLKRGRFQRERELAEKMVAEGYDPLDIAAAALKVARGEDKQRPIHPVTRGGGSHSPYRQPRVGSRISPQFLR
jgi:ATP-dependent RNA helicase DeaD